MSRGRSKPQMRMTHSATGTVVSVSVDARTAAFGSGRGVMPPPGRVHDAQKNTSRYKRREDKRRGRQAMRGGNYDDM